MARPGPWGGQYQPLTNQQIEQIHQASLAVLEHTGLLVENEAALALFRQGGARLEERRVYLSPSMIQAALQTVLHQVLLAGRDPDNDVVLEGGRVYAGTGGSPTQVLDPGADAVRPATLRDLADWFDWPMGCATAISSSCHCSRPMSALTTPRSTVSSPA
jgi:trimethylamine--corrinoid protein Co-methyltransferase